MAQDLGGPPALSGVGAPLVSPPSDARARLLLPAPYLAVSPATGDSVCRDTGPESYCLDGSMLASTAPPPRPPFQLSPSAPTFYPSSSRTPVEQVLHPPSCVYFILHRVSTIHRFQLRVIVCFHARLQSRRTSRRVYSLSLLWLCLVSRLRLRIRLIRFHLRIHLIRLCIKRVYHRDHHRILHQQ